jgi:hypothetical protein
MLSRSEAQRRHAKYYGDILRSTNQSYIEGAAALESGLRVFDLEWANIEAGQKWASTHAENDETAKYLCSTYPDAGMELLDLRLHAHERIKWLQVGLTAAQSLMLTEATGVHLNNLGLAYADLGQYQQAVCTQRLSGKVSLG